jgi:hypothetical protein
MNFRTGTTLAPILQVPEIMYGDRSPKLMQIYEDCVLLNAKQHGCYAKMLIYLIIQFDIHN